MLLIGGVERKSGIEWTGCKMCGGEGRERERGKERREEGGGEGEGEGEGEKGGREGGRGGRKEDRGINGRTLK